MKRKHTNAKMQLTVQELTANEARRTLKFYNES